MMIGGVMNSQKYRPASTLAPTPAARPLLCTVLGNSIAALDQFSGTDWGPSGEVLIANMLAGGPLRFARTTATTYMDVFGVYGWPGARMWQILPDVETNWFAPWATAGLIPDVVILPALFENDIGDAETTANCIRRLRELMTSLQRWRGVRVVIGTPHPSTSYNTAAKQQIYQDMRAHILSLHDGVRVFAYRQDQYEDPAVVGNPLAGYTDGVHPNPKGAFPIARELAKTLKLLVNQPAWGKRLQHPNLALSGSVSVTGANIAGGSTGPTGFTLTSVGAGKTVTTLAEQSGLLVTVAQTLGQNWDIGVLRMGSLTVSGGASTQVTPLIEVEIVSGASLIRQIDLVADITDGGGLATRKYMHNGGALDDGTYQDGDILTLVMPPQIAASGTISAVNVGLIVRAKTGPGGSANAIVGGTYQFRVRAVGVLVE